MNARPLLSRLKPQNCQRERRFDRRMIGAHTSQCAWLAIEQTKFELQVARGCKTVLTPEGLKNIPSAWLKRIPT